MNLLKIGFNGYNKVDLVNFTGGNWMYAPEFKYV